MLSARKSVQSTTAGQRRYVAKKTSQGLILFEKALDDAKDGDDVALKNRCRKRLARLRKNHDFEKNMVDGKAVPAFRMSTLENCRHVDFFPEIIHHKCCERYSRSLSMDIFLAELEDDF